MRALLDTDVVLDVILARAPFASAAGQLLDLSEQGAFEAYISAITPINIFYIARKAKSTSALQEALVRLLQTVRVCPLDHTILINALVSPFTDYEDAVQHLCALTAGLDVLITRNLDDYKNANLPVFSPADFLKQLQAQQP
ncbi:MAG TPA: PIN domain-containing protein [Pyrinomonadaceae bacterium]|jgi:predicted nucleic acid-binding protein